MRLVLSKLLKDTPFYGTSIQWEEYCPGQRGHEWGKGIINYDVTTD